jgi:hypothetical protein
MVERSMCWEILKWRRESDSPAFPDHRSDCFAVTATWSSGGKQGSFTEKMVECRKVREFYQDMMIGGR